MYHVQDAQQVLLARDEHFALKGIAPERRVVDQCQLQRRFERHEHDDEVDRLAGRLDVFGIILAGQFGHVRAYRLDMFLQSAVFVFCRMCIDIAFVGNERHF